MTELRQESKGNDRRYNKANREVPKINSAQSNPTAFAGEAAALELAAVGFAVFVAVEEGVEDGVPEPVVFVEFNCSNGCMTASSMCMRPL